VSHNLVYWVSCFLIWIDRFIIKDSDRLPKEFEKKSMPNLVAVISISYTYDADDMAIIGTDLSTTLRKSLSAATLYGIIALTPGHRWSSVEVDHMPNTSSLFFLDSAFLIPDTTVRPSWTTPIQLLKLAGRADSETLRDCEKAQSEGAKRDEGYHLVLNMTLQGYHAFAKRVSISERLHSLDIC
jgi:hypothetical protein